MRFPGQSEHGIDPGGYLRRGPDGHYRRHPQQQGQLVGELGPDAILQEAETNSTSRCGDLHDNEHDVAYRGIPADHLGTINKGESDDDINPGHGEDQ